MRKVVFQMMTTLNGRVDAPELWVDGISDDLYADINEIYATFDTLIMGHTIYNELVTYWPQAGTEEGASETLKSMAHKMNTYKKYVFSRQHEKTALPWNNTEYVLAHTDQDIITAITQLKAQPGSDIHLLGGASFAQTVIRLRLVDEYRLYLYPVVSTGATWFDQITEKHDLDFLSSQTYPSGVVSLFYKSNKA